MDRIEQMIGGPPPTPNTHRDFRFEDLEVDLGDLTVQVSAWGVVDLDDGGWVELHFYNCREIHPHPDSLYRTTVRNLTEKQFSDKYWGDNKVSDEIEQEAYKLVGLWV